MVELVRGLQPDQCGAGDELAESAVEHRLPAPPVLRPGPPPDHPELATALDLLSERGRKPEHVLDALGKGLREWLADGLVESGVLRQEKHRVLGLFPTKRLPAADTAHETTVRERVLAALNGAEPDEWTAAMVALLAALNAVTTLFDVPDKRAARRRAKEIAEVQWAAVAVHKAAVAATFGPPRPPVTL